MPQIDFSAQDRAQFLEQAASEKHDLIVIGGGITGAGIMLDASSRGLKTVLFEKKDFASGTSSRSTKLIHGGLRYLKQMEFKLVKEVGKERVVIHRNAPHLVIPEKMLLPIIKGGSLGRMTTAAALFVYDRLAGVKREERFQMLSAKAVLEEEARLRTDILKGGALYTEYRTDDARLTIECIKTARTKGGMALNYTEVEELLYEEGKVVGVKVRDTESGEVYEVFAHVIVNAAGPWVDKIRAIDQSLKGKRLHHTKGVHLVFPYEKLALKHSLYFDAMDGRMVFAIPRGKITYVGTTDTSYQGDLHEPGVTQADVEYVLGAANRMFPEANLQASDIISTWSGLRPLIHEDGKSPSELSRKDEIFYSNTQLISIAGGKLTGFRKMAERVTNVVVKRLEENGLIEDRPNCLTANIRLVGNGFHDAEAVEDYIHLLASEHVALGLDEQNAAYLVYNYGKQSDEILEKAYSLQSSYEENALVVAELDFCLRNEMVTRLQDFLIRRTGRLYFDRPSIMPIFADCLDYAASFLGWDAQEKDRQKQDFMRLYEGVVNFGGEVYVE